MVACTSKSSIPFLKKSLIPNQKDWGFSFGWAKKFEKTAIDKFMEINFRSFTAEKIGEVRTGVAATESPISMPDGKGRMIDETLLMSGAQLPESRAVPLIDSHDRSSIENIKGSFENLRTENGKLVGDIRISSSEPETQTKLDERHVNDLSVGYGILERTQIPANEVREIQGRSFKGPASIVTRWNVREVSLTPLGADQLAKIRSEYIDKEIPANTSRGKMDNETKDTLPVVNNNTAEVNDTPNTPNNTPNPVRTEPVNESVQPDISESDIQRAVDSAMAKRVAFTTKVRSQCERHGLKDCADEIVKCDNEHEANRMILDKIAERHVKISPIHFGTSQEEKTGEGMVQAIMLRGMGRTRFEKLVPKEERHASIKDFQNASLVDLSRFCLEQTGCRTWGMSTQELAKRAFDGVTEYHSGQRSVGDSYLSTGNFTSILANVLNKTLLATYLEPNFTYNLCFKQGPSVRDFKPQQINRRSEFPFLEVTPAGQRPNETSLSDKNEKLLIDKYSKLVTIDWESIVNDDLGALVTLPSDAARAAQRTLNRVCWSVLTANANMSDGNPLYGTVHVNYVAQGSGAAPSTSTLGTARSKMRVQTGLNGAIINVQPRYLVVPTTLETAATQLCLAPYDVTANLFQVPNTFSGIIPITEPQLDASSTTQWYVLSDNNDLTTVQYSFLQGQESPVVEQERNFYTHAFELRIEQSFGAKAVDWQGIFANFGA